MDKHDEHDEHDEHEYDNYGEYLVDMMRGKQTRRKPPKQPDINITPQQYTCDTNYTTFMEAHTTTRGQNGTGRRPVTRMAVNSTQTGSRADAFNAMFERVLAEPPKPREWFPPVTKQILEYDDIITMLQDETRMRKSSEYQTMASWAHHDMDGNAMSTPDDIELYIQRTVLKKRGYPATEEMRVAYLQKCHELYNAGDTNVHAIDAPHLAHNPFNAASQVGVKLDVELC